MSSDNIKVVVRARPLKKCNVQFVPWVIDDKKIYQTDEDNTPIGDTYSYDEVFNVNTKNVDIYDTAISSLVSSAIDGINLTIFAYGATSSGKTFTMNGIPEDPGMIPRFIEDLFNQVESYSHRKFLIRVSYVEIYSEIINDLLDKSNKDLKVREDINNTVSYNPTEKIVKSSSECMSAMKLGTVNRTVGETNMNLFSSRSHSIFRIVIESAPTTSDENDPVQVSHVNLIDLAGSERVSQTGATGQRFKEGAHINKSLTVLGLVIKQLVEKKDYVNYRDSKLTRILSNSLGGNAKTLIICNINLESLEDTASTLMFAQRAKAIKNKPKVNEIMNEAALTKKYAKECSDIKKLLDVEFEKNKQLEDEREISNKKIKELASRIKSLQEIFVRKETLPRHPKRRHTFCSLGAISEERELETVSKNCLTVGLTENSDHSVSSSFENSDCLPRRNSCSNSTEGQKRVDVTPPKNLRARLEILSREHEELIEYTRTERSESQALASKYEQLVNECQDLKMLIEVKDKQLESEQKNSEQIRIDYEFMLETQTKKFKRREMELLDQIKGSSLNKEVDAPTPIENLPLPNTITINTFEYEEMSERLVSLKQKNEELESITQLVKLENEDLNKLIADLRNSVNTLELQKSQLKIKTKSLQTKVVDMELKVNNSEHHANCSKDDVDSLMKKISDLEGNINEQKIELGKLKDELYESQDKLIEVTEDLDLEEKKKECLEKQLCEEKRLHEEVEMKLVQLRQELQSKIFIEKELEEANSNLAKEKELLQKVELELDNERKLREISDSRFAEEQKLRVEVESNLARQSKPELIEGIKLGQESDLTSLDEIKVEQEMEGNLTKEIELRQKAQMELAREKEMLLETKQKLAEEVEMRQEIMKNLCTLKSILEQKSQHNDLSSQLQQGDSRINDSYLVMSDAEKSLNCTGESLYESIQEIDSDNLENFSSSYFQDSSKSNNFMNFFNSFIGHDDEESKLKDNTETRSEVTEVKYENNMNEIGKLQKDLNALKLQRESDIITIKKLQAQLDEYSYINLSDSQKIDKTHKILGALKLLEDEKVENLSLIQKLKEQCQNDMMNYQELENNFKMSSVELKGKEEKIQMLQTNIDKLNEEINSQTNKSNMSNSHSENEILRIQIETQKNELGKYLESLKDKELHLQNLTQENCSLRDQLETERIRTNQEKEENSNNSIKMDSLVKQVEKLNILIEEKDSLIDLFNKEKMDKKCSIIENNLEYLNNSSSFALQERHGAFYDDEEKYSQIESNKTKITEDQQIETETILNLCEEKVVDHLNEIEKLKKEMENLSNSVQNKEETIALIEFEKIGLAEEKDDLSDKINNLMIQIQSQTNCLEEQREIESRIAKITEENIELIRLQKETDSTLKEEKDKNVNLSNDIEKLKMEYKKIQSLLVEKDIIISDMNIDKTNSQEERNILSNKIGDLLKQIQQQEENEKISNQKIKNVDDLLKNISELQSKVESMTFTIHDKDKIIESFNLKKSDLENEKNDLSDKIINLMKEIQTQTHRLEETNEIMKSKEILIQKISEENEFLKKEQTCTDTKLKEQNERITDLLNKIEELDIESKKLLSKLEKKELDISAIIQSEKLHLEKEISDLHHKMQDLMIQVQTQMSRLEEQNYIIEGKEMHIQKFAQENDILRKGLESAESTLKEQKIYISDLSNDIDKLRNQFEELLLVCKEKELIISKMNTEKDILQEESNKLSIQISDLLMQIKQHEDNELNLKQESEKVADLLKYIKQLETEVENMRITICDKDKIITSLNFEKTALESEKKDFTNKINDLKIQVQKQKNLLAEQNGIIESKGDHIQKFAEENELLKKELEYIQSILNDYKEKNTVLSNNIVTLNIESKNLLSTIQEKDVIISKINTLKTEVEEERNILSVKINQFEAEKLNKVETKYNEELETLKKNNSDLLENLFSLTSINTDLENKMQDLKAEFSEKLGNHIKRLKVLFGIEEKNWKFWEQKLDTKWEDLKKLENLVSTLMKEKTVLVDSMAKLQNVERINKKLTAEIEFQQEQTQFLQITVEKIKKECEHKVSDYEKKLDIANSKLKTIYLEHDQDKKRIENLEYELRTMSKKLKPVGNPNCNSERDVSDYKNPDDKWKQQRTREHDSRRSIDLNTLCSESTVDICKNCEKINKLTQKFKLEISPLNSEISQLKDEIETLNNKYGKMKRLCRLRNDENQELLRKLKEYTDD